MYSTTPKKAIPWPNTPSKTRIGGVYDAEEGWKCECKPRLVAIRRKTVIEGPNKGRWFLRCPEWNSKCNMFRWEDDPETQAMMGAVTPTPKITATQTNYPSLPNPLSYDPFHPASARPSLPPGEQSSLKRLADEIEEEGEETDPDEVEVTKAKAPAARSSRKERRTATKDTPSKGRVSFANASTSFVSACTSFATAPTTPNTGHRSRLAFDQGEDDIFTTRPLQKSPANNLISRLIAASVNPDSRTTFAPETPQRHSRHFPPHLPSPYTPGTSRRTPGSIGLQTPSALTQDVFSFRNELGRISMDLENRLMELMSRQALQAEGFKRGRDINRKLLKESKEKITTLEKRIEELEAEKEMTRQVNEELKIQLDSMRLTSSEVSTPRP
ncbi:hypothetical protein EV426DRAFT_593638 [Tirmania nivea]|nr:hypothetical protein EV426DRAFT_593638 [Tirmania nivea]